MEPRLYEYVQNFVAMNGDSSVFTARCTLVQSAVLP